jgi:CDP-glycerol glycerophosphotransferase
MQHEATRGGVVRRLRRLANRGGRRPDVTVVVTCAEGDQELLPGCRESIARQTHEYVDVRVARGAADELAAARNAEAAAAEGTYLLFLDASERLVEHALADLGGALEGSGSDLVLAGVRDVNPGRAAVTLAEAPGAVTARTLGATLFRRDFWTRAGLRFSDVPDAPAVPVLVRALVAATRIDLIADEVCVAADRAAELPFGHVPHLADALGPWLDAVDETSVLLRPLPAAREAWLHELLDVEAHRFVDATEQADDSQWERLCDVLGVLVEEVAGSPEAWAALRWESRVKGWLVAQRHRVVLEDFVEARRLAEGAVETEVRGGAVFASAPAEVPEHCRELSVAETPLVASLRQMRFVDHTLELDVFAYARLVGDDPARPDPELVAELVDEQGVRRVALKVTPAPSPAATRFARESHQTHDLASFRIAVTADEVLESPSWSVALTWSGYGLTRTGTINHRDHNGTVGERPRRLAGGMLWGPSPVGEGGLRIESSRVVALLTDAAVSGREVRGRLTDPAGGATGLVAVELTHRGDAPVRVPLDPGAGFAVTLPELGFGNRDGEAPEWRLSAVDEDGAEHPVAFPHEVDGHWIGERDGVLSWRRSRGGIAAVHETRHRPAVRAVRLSGDDLVLGMDWLGAEPSQWAMALVGDRVRLPGELRDGELVFATTHDEWGLGRATVPTGAYRLELTLPGGDTTTAIEVAEELGEQTPVELLGDRLRLRVRQSPRRLLVVHVMPPLLDDELGVRAQQLQRERFAAASYSLDPTAVYLQSYTGQTATDSPHVIHEALRRTHPDLKLYWGIEDWSARVPEGAVPVLIRSREWYDVLGSAGYLVNNIDFDQWFVKRPGQRFLQTFHGYPAKSMGLVQWRAKRWGQRRIDAELDRTARKWDLILTPSPEMDEHYRREYAYDGPIHNQGYPRDDPLVSPDAPVAREETRRRLGIAPEQKVVLYAPTFRDHLSTDHRAAVLADHLDLEGASEVLGPDYVFLLRGHRFHAKGERRLASTRRLVDVTDYPEVNDLILAADVAVLDYSSLRFDFALTGRPMVFLVPDLETYSGPVRGFLFDFASSAPGPLVRDATEVVELLRDIDGLAARCAPDIAAFNERFQRFQDGRAAERVVDAFFGSPVRGQGQ